ncbi:MAG: hypothetical protein HQL69_08790 [Magnetococcales bacterium]|nr:hypothetical protein [Magnetococcales bacterium]
MLNSAITAILGGVFGFLLEYVNYLVTNKGMKFEMWLKAHLVEVGLWVVFGVFVGWVIGSIMTPKNTKGYY